MKTQRSFLAVLATTLIFCLAAPLPATADVSEAQIAAARTAADHQAIADAYAADAADAEAHARAHEAMANTYRQGGAPKASTKSLVHHCEKLVASYRSLASEYQALAAEHRKLAAELQQ